AVRMGLVLAPGEAGRDARSEASAAGQAPVALYTGEALPEEMIACRVGVTLQTVEVPDLDEAFFAGLLRHREDRGEIRERKREREERPAAAQEEASPPPPLAESTAIASAGTGEPEAAPEAAPEEVPSEAQPGAETAAPGAGNAEAGPFLTAGARALSIGPRTAPMHPAKSLAALAIAATACKPSASNRALVVGSISVSEAGLAGKPEIGESSEALREQVRAALEASGRFAVREGGPLNI